MGGWWALPIGIAVILFTFAMAELAYRIRYPKKH